jgi:uncharacterized protein with GYD domain
MAFYLMQLTYTPEAWAVMMQSSHGPFEALRALLEQLGGTLESGWLAVGEAEGVLICQLPDPASAAALAIAATGEGLIKAIKTTPLMTVQESLEALQKAAAAQAQTAGRAPGAGGLPVPRSKPLDYKEMLSARLQKFRQRMEKMVTGR